MIVEPEIKWIIGLGVSVLAALASMIVAAFRSVGGRFAAVHGRIDKVKDDYVRRDDLDGHIQRIETNITDMRKEMQRNHDAILQHLAGIKK